MPCISTKYTESEIRDMLLSKKVSEIGETKDILEKARILRTMNSMVTTKDVAYEELDTKVRNDLGLKPGESVPRYFLDQHMLSKRRTTDWGTRSFIKSEGLERAREISQRVNTIVKAQAGEAIHFGTEELTKSILELGELSTTFNNMSIRNLMSLSEVEGRTVDTMSEIALQRELKLSDKSYRALRQGVEKILKTISETQNKIDPDGRAILLPEQFVLNPKEDFGGKIDLLVLFSDGTHGVLDYKTYMPGREKLGHSNKIVDSNWIPYYKKATAGDQITRLNQTIEQFYGSKGARISRVIPIHIRLAVKPIGQQTEPFSSLSQHINFIDMGVEQDTLITHIPVGEQITLRDPREAEKLNRQISKLSININNEKLKLKQLTFGTPAHTQLAAAIKNRETALEKIVLDQDFTYLFRGFESLLRRLTEDGRFTTLKNVDDAEINGQPNPDYLTLEELSSAIQDVETFDNIIKTSPYVIEEMNPNQDPKIYNDYLERVKALSWDSERILDQLRQRHTDRVVNKQEYDAMNDVTQPGFYAKWFRTLGEQVAVPFRKLRSYLDKANNERRIKMQKFHRILEEHNKKLSELGKRIGKSRAELFEMMINPKTENIWAQHSKDFYTTFETARQEKDAAWLGENLELKADARETYHRNLEVFKRTNFLSHVEDKKAEFEKDLERWKSQNSIENAIYGNKWWLYYKPKQNLQEDYYSDGYKQIRQHKELLDYWNFWIESMTHFNDLLGLKGSERVPANFLPYIRQDIVGMMAQGTFDLGQIGEAVRSIFALRQDDTGLGEMVDDGAIDPETGKSRNTIPRYFINPIKDGKGNIRRGVKLRDLSKSMYIYGEMAYNYHYLKAEVEPRIEALRDLMIEKGMQKIDENKKKRKLLTGVWARITGADTDVVRLFDKYVNYHLYGIKIQDSSKQWAKVVGTLKSIQSFIELGGSALLWAGNLTQITSNAYFEGNNGYYYTKKHMMDTQAEGSGLKGAEAKKLYDAATYLFEFSPKIVDVRKKHLSTRKAERWINYDTAFYGMRKSEQAVNNNIGMSILKNWTEVNGELVRMEDAPKDAKSFFEKAKITDGFFQIEGITDNKGNVTDLELYTKVRNLAIGVATSVKGQLNPEDLASVYMSIAPNAAMGFKTWLPGMADARLSQLRYDPQRNRMTEGKWMSLVTDLSKDDQSYASWLGNVVAPSIARLAANVATFGLSDKTNIGRYKVNELRARRMFDNYKNQHKHDFAIQAMKFEDYVAYKRGQIKATASELRMILALVGMVMALRMDWDDDGQADWQKNWYTRTMFRAINRARREVGFLVSWEDWRYTIFRAPIPIMSLPLDANKALWSALSGIGDFVRGEERPPGERSKFYPAFRMLPFNKTILFFEPDDFSHLREV